MDGLYRAGSRHGSSKERADASRPYGDRLWQSPSGHPQYAESADPRHRRAPKALVWQDDQGKVWLTFNSGEYLHDYVYPPHGLPSNPVAAKAFDEFVVHAAKQATE